MHRRDGKLIVSATDLVGFLECGHLTRLERAAAAGKVTKPIRTDDPVIELLQWRGGKHEERYIEQLRGKGNRTIIDLKSNRALSYADQAAKTREAMERGDDVIYQGTVFDGEWLGYPDFLLRKHGASRLGDYHYEVADTKLAHSAKASALVQICAYVDQLAGIQGVAPALVYVVTGGADIAIHDFRTAEMMAYYRHAKSRFLDAIDDAKAGEPTHPIDRQTSYPDPVEHCGVCRWFYEYCRQQWRDDDALPLVAGISRGQRQNLETNSVSTMTSLSTLTQPLTLGLKRSQNDSMWRMREQARLQIASKDRKPPIYELLKPETDADGGLVPDRGLAALHEPSAGDLFFDIEGDPFAFWEGLEYLFGIWDGAAYRQIWALDRDTEKLAFEEVMDLFVGRLEQFPDMHIYHYAPYEPSALKRLAARHGTREEELDRLLRARVFVDLYRVVRQGLQAGVPRYSIKNLEDLYGFTRTIELRDANSSIVEFEKMLEIGDPDGKLTELIAGYNKDDCVSTKLLRDWLETLRPDVAAQFNVDLPRPPEPTPEAAAVIRPQDIEVRGLEARLTADLPVAADRNHTQQQTWLLAQLLDWHNRERKSSWWRFFELMTLSPQELITEKEAIGGLDWVEIVGTNKAGNVIHRYRYPAQDHDVGDQSKLHNPARPAFDGSGLRLAWIDDVNLTLDLSHDPEFTGPHPKAVVPDNTVYSEAQEKALLRIGHWVAQDAIDSDSPAYWAARNLLLRMAPRAGQATDEKLVGSLESGSAVARRVATHLDGTTLAIQGPPGSGKTYTGARMILDLVRAGRKVGITSNSHKVIGHLLKAVCDAAEEEHVTLRPMQKGEKDEVITHPFVEVRRARGNGDVDKALRLDEVDVVAGTPWLWARGEIEGKIDTLFIDEAGQVSLANVVAVAGCARNVVLLGDPQQLDQPTQGVHPDGAGRSALAHLLDSAKVIAPDKGIFLEKTWRMHPDITAYSSELFYEGQLKSLEGLENQRVVGEGELSGSGVRWVPINHDGNTDESLEEADRVCEIWKSLIAQRWVDADGKEQVIRAGGIVILTPFNAQRKLIADRLPPEARVGTVDKFQGQQAPVSIYTMATSRPEDAPRGVGFLYSLNRLNVATSRARALSIVVASPRLLDAVPRSPDQLRMVNGLCAFVDAARRGTPPPSPPTNTELPIQLVMELG